ncbi:MAG: phosphoenolpyruvate hydrolase family protein [Lachnospiraceae bacterium]|nr:phosphoenolpyruvate hydrolase family protein [Lachnospiraceae bacterium]
MAKQYTREEMKARVQAQIDAGSPIVITGAGTGISAKFAELGGADMIGIYNSGFFRMDGKGSTGGLMPYANGNDLLLQLTHRVFPIVKEVPMIAGICGSDPTREMKQFLQELKFWGFSVVMNYPTIGGWRGKLRADIEAAGLGVKKETETLVMAKEMGFYTIAYAYDEEAAILAAKAAVDIIICHLGMTVGGSTGSNLGGVQAFYDADNTGKKAPLDEAVDFVNMLIGKIREINKEVICFAHGGPIATPEDTQYIYDRTQSKGFLGASSAERIPIEGPLTEAVQKFKAARLKRG